MTPFEAAEAIVHLNNGHELHDNSSSEHIRCVTYGFSSLGAADHCKAILDALLPGATGAVFGPGRLVLQMFVTPGPQQPAIDQLLADVKLAELAAHGDSNDTEIDLLRGALHEALGLLGVEVPEVAAEDDDYTLTQDGVTWRLPGSRA